MGLWNKLLSLLNIQDKEVKKNCTVLKRNKFDICINNNAHKVGNIYHGRVDYIGDKFVKVSSGGLSAVVFLNEMSEIFINHPSEVFREGQQVEFVLLDNNVKGWVASIKAVSNEKTNSIISKLSKGDRVSGSIEHFKDKSVTVNTGTFDIIIPIAEISWNWIEHPSDAVSLGEHVEVEIIQIELSSGQSSYRKRRSTVFGSIRACIAEPNSPLISVAYSCLPFKLWAIAKTPSDCDPVVLFILEELVKSKTKNEISTITGLPNTTLDKIHELLVDHYFVKDWIPTKKGIKLTEAIDLARKLNADPIRGLFASAAHPTKQFLPATASSEYPSGWPKPPINKFLEDSFITATDEALPEALIERIVPDDKRSNLSILQEDDRLRVFLRRESLSRSIFIDTPEYWFFAGLWYAFEPLIGKPYRSMDKINRLRYFLMIRCVDVTNVKHDSLKYVFYEPYTKTIWRLVMEEKVKIFDLKNKNFPDLSILSNLNIKLGSEEVAVSLKPDSWCRVNVR